MKEIVLFGNPVLRADALEIKKFDKKLHKLLNEMKKILYAKSGRAGLAAPQVGESVRAVILDCGTGYLELINPKIVEAYGEAENEEGCLSFPGFSGNVRRASYVKVIAFDRFGKEITVAGDGLLGRCLQHEIDHINGVIYIDRIIDGVVYNERTKETLPLSNFQHLLISK